MMLRARRALVAGGSLLCISATLPAQTTPGDSVVYRLDPRSRFEVKTGKAGFFSFMGHEHLIRADSVRGTVVYFPATPDHSTVDITVPSAGLEVLTPPDTAEIRKVTATMRSTVLRTDSFPEIRFRSTAVTPTEGGFQVVGDFTLTGQTHPVTVEMRTRLVGDSLWAEGSFSLQQTTYGIKPFRGGPGGSVRVADRVTIRIAAVGVRVGS